MSVDDLIVIPIEMLISLITIGLVIFAFGAVHSAWNGATTGEAQEFEGSVYNSFNSLVGYSFLAIFIGLIIAAVIIAMLLPTSIIWAPLFAIGTIIATIISIPMKEAYTQILSTPTFTQYSTNFQIAAILLSRMPLIILVLGGILTILTFIKWKQDQVMPIGGDIY